MQTTSPWRVTLGIICTGLRSPKRGGLRSGEQSPEATRPRSGLGPQGVEVRDEDVARLSPLGFEHINLLGRYKFGLPPELRRGELRPLREPMGQVVRLWLPR